jgi:hypothetical protein
MEMNMRSQHEDAGTLESQEARAAFKASERARWAEAQQVRIVGTWAPTMTKQKKQEHERYVVEHKLPF